jgi:hypothetical protein
MSREQQTDSGGYRAETLAAAGVYQLLSPLLAGRTVLEVWPLLADGRARLERAGAGEVICLAPEAASLPLAEASVDIVLCLGGLGPQAGTDYRPWIAEFRRVLQPEGLFVFRMQCAAKDVTPARLAALLGGGYLRTTTVAETPFVGVAFFVPTTDDMAVGGDLAGLATAPSHHLLLATRAPAPAWQLSESLFVPLDELGTDLARRAGWQKQVDAERDDLRETLMSLQDEIERRQAGLTAFRRRLARHLQQTTDSEGALEALALERDQLEQRALRAENALTEMEVTSRRRQVELAALETELSRLRARPPGARNASPPPGDQAGQGEGLGGAEKKPAPKPGADPTPEKPPPKTGQKNKPSA